MVEEEAVARVREEERNRDIASRSVVDVAVPEPSRRAESVERLPTLAKTVEMLLADYFEAEPAFGRQFDFGTNKSQFWIAGAIAEFKRVWAFRLPEEEWFAFNCHVRICGNPARRRKLGSPLDI